MEDTKGIEFEILNSSLGPLLSVCPPITIFFCLKVLFKVIFLKQSIRFLAEERHEGLKYVSNTQYGVFCHTRRSF